MIRIRIFHLKLKLKSVIYNQISNYKRKQPGRLKELDRHSGEVEKPQLYLNIVIILRWYKHQGQDLRSMWYVVHDNDFVLQSGWCMWIRSLHPLRWLLKGMWPIHLQFEVSDALMENSIFPEERPSSYLTFWRKSVSNDRWGTLTCSFLVTFTSIYICIYIYLLMEEISHFVMDNIS